MTTSANNIIHNRIKSWIPVLLWMVVIFLFSAQPATESSELSGSITKRIFDLIATTPLSNMLGENLIHTLIRKCAHFTIYLVLGTLVYRALNRDDSLQRKRVLVAFIICVLYAATDEFHQLYVPGRSGQFTDILIDSFGAFIGIMACSTILKWRK